MSAGNTVLARRSLVNSATDVIHVVMEEKKRAFALLILDTVKQTRREGGHKTARGR
jgi:hypothetical protein